MRVFLFFGLFVSALSNAKQCPKYALSYQFSFNHAFTPSDLDTTEQSVLDERVSAAIQKPYEGTVIERKPKEGAKGRSEKDFEEIVHTNPQPTGIVLYCRCNASAYKPVCKTENAKSSGTPACDLTVISAHSKNKDACPEEEKPKPQADTSAPEPVDNPVRSRNRPHH